MLTAKDLHNLLPSFIENLTSNSSSRSTIKNYTSDLRTILQKVNPDGPLGQEDLKGAIESLRGQFSDSTLRRFGYSLKAFTSWADKAGHQIPVASPSKAAVSAPVDATTVATAAVATKAVAQPSPVEDYVSHLQAEGATEKASNYYKKDLENFTNWYKPGQTELNSGQVEKVSRFDINRYTNYLRSKQVSQASINRYLHSLSSFFAFHKKPTVYQNNPVRAGVVAAGLTIPLLGWTLSKPRWWHAYRGHPMSDYLNWTGAALALIVTSLLLYQTFFPQQKIDINNLKTEIQEGLVLGATPPRILSFQGRLTDASGNPITSATNFVFRIWDQSSGGTEDDCGGAPDDCFWKSKTWSITPDSNGIFSVQLGDTGQADTAIPSSLFADNADLWLGVQIGGDAEATPRQRIASTAYALNSDTLDGFDSVSFLRADANSNLLTGNTLQLNDGSTFTVNSTSIGIGNATGDAITVNGTPTFNTDTNFTLAGTENVAMTSDLAGTVDVISIVGTPSGSAGTTQGLFIQQANSGNGNGLDVGIKIDNADADLLLTDAISITNTGGGGNGYTNYINTPNFDVTAAGGIVAADLTLGLNDSSATISTQDTDENLTIDPNGTGTIFFHGATYGITSAGALTVSSCTGCGGGATAWDAIGDPAGDGVIEFGSTEQVMNFTDFTDTAFDGFIYNFDNNGGTAGTDNGIVLNNAVSTNASGDLNTESLLLLQQLDDTGGGTTVLDNAIKIDAAASSGITNGIQITNSAGNITDGILIADTGGGTISKGIELTGTFTDAFSSSSGNVTNILGATNIVKIDNTAAIGTNSTTATATLNVNSKSATSGNTGVSFDYTSTATATATQYGTYGNFTAATALATDAAPIYYGLYQNISKSGSDANGSGVNHNIYAIAGIASNSSTSFSGNIFRRTFGGYFTATNSGPTGQTTGVYASGTGGATNYGVDIAAISTAGNQNIGLNIGNLSGATSVTGINLGTLGGGTGSTIYGINSGTLTSATSTATAYQANLGNVVGISGASFGSIRTGTVSGAGTNSYGLNLGANSSTATSNYGVNIGAVSGAGTTNYGINIGTISGAGTNYDIKGINWQITAAGALTVVSCTGCGGGGATLQTAYDAGNTISTTSGNNIAFTLADVATPTMFSLTQSDPGGTSAFYLNNANGSGTNTNGILIEQTGSGALTNGLNITRTAGTLTNGLNFSGTFTNLINAPNFVVTNAGDITISGGDVTGANGDSIDIAETADSQFTLNLNSDSTVSLVAADSANANTPFTIRSAGTGTLTLNPTGTGDIVLTSTNTGTAAIDINVTGSGGDLDIDINDAITVDSASVTFTIASGTTDFTIAGIDSDSNIIVAGLAGANAVLYAAPTTGVFTTATTTTGSQCLVSTAGASGTPSWGSCGSGSQTPWTSDIDADGFDLTDLSNIEFRETTGAPAGSSVAIFRDNSGDLNLNALTSKTINLQVNGSDQFRFGSNLNLVSTTSDIVFGNGESIHNDTDGQVNIVGKQWVQGNAGIGANAAGAITGEILRVVDDVVGGTCFGELCSGVFSGLGITTSSITQFGGLSFRGTASSYFGYVGTEATTLTVPRAAIFYASNFGTKGAGSTVTDAVGLFIEPVTMGTNNYGICFDCDGTFGTTTVATGIQFGNDAGAAQIYRNGTNQLTLGTTTTLQTPDSFTIDLKSTTTNTLSIRNTNDITSRANVDIYGRLIKKGFIGQTTLTNISDVYIYDTTRDSDGGRWNNSYLSKQLSWYTETKDDGSSDLCNNASDDRCGQSDFPTKVVLVATPDALYIFNANGYKLWMKFTQGGTFALGADTNNNPSSVFGLNGVVYVSTNGASGTGLYAFDFINDRMYRYNTTDRNLGDKNIANRNTTVNYNQESITTLQIADNIVNDVHGAVMYGGSAVQTSSGPSNGLTFIALATDTGMSVINISDKKTWDIADNAGDDYNSIFLTKRGRLYALNENTDNLERYGASAAGGVNIDWLFADSTSATPTYTYEDTATTKPNIGPATVAVGLSPDALEVVERGSSADESADLIYVGTDQGLAEIHDVNVPAANTSMGWSKFYSTTRQTPFQMGSTKGMWLMDDASGDLANSTPMATNNGLQTAAGGATYGGAGVHGKSIALANNTMFCSDANNDNTCDNDTDYNIGDDSMTVSLWFNHSTNAPASGTDILVSKRFSAAPATVAGWEIWMTTGCVINFAMDDDATWNDDGAAVTTTQTYCDGRWHHMVASRATTDGALTLTIDGKTIQDAGVASAGNDGAGAILSIGGDCSAAANCTTGANFWDGSIDDVVVSMGATSTGDATSHAQARKMFLEGKAALDQKIINVTDATTVSSTTIGDSGETWVPNEFVGRIVEITGGTGAGQTRTVVSNTATVLTVAPAFTVTPDTTSDFEVNPEQLYGGTNTVTAIGVSDTEFLGKDRIYWVGTSDGSDGGGISVFRGNGGAVVKDVYHAGAGKTDDAAVAWSGGDHDDIKSIDVRSDFIAVGTDAKAWTEYEDQNLQEELDILTNNINSIRGELASDGLSAASFEVGQLGGADLAEYYYSSQSLQPGQVVALDSSKKDGIKSSNSPYQSNVIGVISTAPGLILGEKNEEAYLVALTGRVPVYVSTENGPVKNGDLLTASSTPGYAMKATEGGRVIGLAMEDFEPASENCQTNADFPIEPEATTSAAPETSNPTSQVCFGTVTVFINPHHASASEVDPTVLNVTIDSLGNMVTTIGSGSKFVWNNSYGQAVAWVNDQGEAFFAKVTAEVADFRKLVFGEAVVKKEAKTAGSATFETGATEILIESDKVNEESLINLTTETKTNGVSLYVKEKRPGEGFVVALERNSGDQPDQASASAAQAIKFSWFILNQE